jgi:hypothetical protein
VILAFDAVERREPRSLHADRRKRSIIISLFTRSSVSRVVPSPRSPGLSICAEFTPRFAAVRQFSFSYQSWISARLNDAFG